MTKRLLAGFTAIVLFASVLIAQEQPVSQTKFDVRDGTIATRDGRPGTLMAQFIQAEEDDLSTIAVRKLDVIYGRKYGAALTMDVYRPQNNANGAGVIQIISGGLWSGPEYRRMPVTMSYIRMLVEQGYTVFAVIHSSQPKFSLLEVQHDVPRSVRYIRHRAQDFGIDPGRIGVVGFSSGGHLALLVATATVDSHADAEDPVDRVSSRVQAAVAYFPNTDCLNYGREGKLISEHFREQGLKTDAEFDFHRWDDDRCVFAPMTDLEMRDAFREISPLTHLSRDDAPTLLVHGDKDELVPIEQSRKFQRRMNEVGADCELFVVSGKGHGWAEPLPDEVKRVGGWFDRHLFSNGIDAKSQ
jgi:acetyl esterase/lipase